MVRGRGVVLEVRADEAVGPLGLWGEVLPRLIQWASRKKRISYDFNFYLGSTRHIPKSFRSAALSTATQPW